MKKTKQVCLLCTNSSQSPSVHLHSLVSLECVHKLMKRRNIELNINNNRFSSNEEDIIRSLRWFFSFFFVLCVIEFTASVRMEMMTRAYSMRRMHELPDEMNGWHSILIFFFFILSFHVILLLDIKYGIDL